MDIPLTRPIGELAEQAPETTSLETEVIALFDQMRVRVLRYVITFGLGSADAEEVVQDVFLALHRHLAGGKPRSSLRAWIFQVAHNLSLRRRLAASRTSEDLDSVQLADPAPSAEDTMVWRQRQERLRAVVDALPAVDRQCLILRSEGLRYREIASVLGISLGGVANSLARSLARLSAVMER